MADGGRTARDQAIAGFLARAGWDRAERKLLAGDASFRRYDRLIEGARRAVLMDAPPPQENVRPFLAVARLLAGMELSAPRIFAADEEAGLVLLEDLGDDTYTRLLARSVDPAMLYERAVDLLIALQRRLTPADLVSLPVLDDARALREVSLLLDWYWPAMRGAAAPEPVRAEFLAAWRDVLPKGRRLPAGFVHFDFHVDNLLWLPERPGVAACGLLDFQDAMQGPLSFDLMSLLQDARRDIDPGLGAALQDRFLAAFPSLDREAFADAYAVFGAERHTRILGTFTRLLKRDGKPGYLVHMPRVWRQLETALARPALAPLARWFDRHLPPAVRGVPEARGS
jgi:aminoglycoside/choline kinase family phosphotransferase